MNDPACCGSEGCVFAKALLAKGASCELSRRAAVGEGERIECTSAPARMNCETLAALFHERARFALRLPAPGRPLMHVHALRLQCGGLAAVRSVLEPEQRDVHGLVRSAQERHGSLADLPWDTIVPALAAWERPRRR